VRGVEAKSCWWPCNEFMLGAGIKEEFDQYIHNTELSAFITDKPPQHYSLTHSFTQKFEYHSRTSRVSFHLYDRSYSMSLEEFCDACKIPFWGSLSEPRQSDYELFLNSLCNCEDRGVTQARIKSIHAFPLFSILHSLMANALVVNKTVVHFVLLTWALFTLL
jgi:hypothetical protein